jgi:hypothetical protein
MQLDEFSNTMPPMFFDTKLLVTVQLTDSVSLIPYAIGVMWSILFPTTMQSRE